MIVLKKVVLTIAMETENAKQTPHVFVMKDGQVVIALKKFKKKLNAHQIVIIKVHAIMVYVAATTVGQDQLAKLENV